MAYMWGLLARLLLLLAICPLSLALKFDLKSNTKDRCIRNFAAKDTLVVVTINVDGQKDGNEVVNVHIKDALGNEYQKSKDVSGENRYAFTTSADAAFDVCFENVYHRGPAHGKHIELDVDIGADVKESDAAKSREMMKPLEADLERIERTMDEVVREMEYLREREIKLRDTNESTNERVKYFAIMTMVVLVGLGAWQILYLRAYFRSKHLI